LFWSSGLAAIAALVARTLEYFGQLDFAVNHACVALDGGAGIAKYERNFRPDNEHQRAERLFSVMKHQIPHDSQIPLAEESKPQAGRNIIQVRLPDSFLLL
jgi:hypothetical protein